MKIKITHSANFSKSETTYGNAIQEIKMQISNKYTTKTQAKN